MKEFIKNFDEEKLKEAFRIKEAYTNGELSLEMANAQMKAHVGSLSSAEIAYMEQYFSEEVDEECIQEDIHKMMALYEDVLVVDKDENKLFAGHPIQNYIDENSEIKKLLVEIDELLEKKYILNQWEEVLEKLNLFKTHLSRKQNQLYTPLEKKGFDRPTTTMWLYDNLIRDTISEFRDLMLSYDGDAAKAKQKFAELKEIILDLMDKEETILYPTSLEMLDKAEFIEMVAGDAEIGYCLIEPTIDLEAHADFKTEVKQAENNAQSSDLASDLANLLAKHNFSTWTEDTKMEVKQGLMSLKQINLLFQHLPVDLSYVDEDEMVAFYSDTKHRVFPRSKGVIGRKVQNCHPANSVAVVEEIISKFRSGEKDEAEFWINKPNLFIYIKYIAVRDQQGNFKGVLEMMQDCTAIRALEGSKTLLDWDQDQQEEAESATVDEKIVQLKPDTKMSVLFEQYPTLKQYMLDKCDKFAMLNSPMFKVVGKVATAAMVSERTGIDFETLAKEFELFVKNQ